MPLKIGYVTLRDVPAGPRHAAQTPKSPSRTMVCPCPPDDSTAPRPNSPTKGVVYHSMRSVPVVWALPYTLVASPWDTRRSGGAPAAVEAHRSEYGPG